MIHAMNKFASLHVVTLFASNFNHGRQVASIDLPSIIIQNDGVHRLEKSFDLSWFVFHFCGDYENHPIHK